MTIKALHKLLAKAVSKGLGRYKVCVYKTTFTHPCESDGCVILDVDSAAMEFVNLTDDDGGCAENQDGTERMFYAMVLCGDDGRGAFAERAKPPAPGQEVKP